MRICIVMEYHPDDATGGSEVQVFGLACQFAKLGHQVFYVCQRYDRSRATDEIIEGVRVLRALRWHKVFRFLAASRLFRTVRRLRPDVIYQRFASPYTGLAALSARLIGVPFVWGCAEDVSVEGDVFRRAVLRVARRGPVALAKICVLRCNAWFNQVLFEGGLRGARAVIAQNHRQAELLERNYERQAVIIPNGVQLVEESTERSPAPLVLWLNNLLPRKQPEAFVELARSLADRHPGTEFAMVGGRAEDTYMRSLRRLAADIPGLVLYGPIPHAETASWFQRAWVYVHTSSSEGFPNVMLQAWAANTPVVSLTVDPDDLIRDEGLGLLSRTQGQLERDVSRLLDDAALRQHLAGISRAFVSEHFELAKVAERYLILFQRLRGSGAESSAAT